MAQIVESVARAKRRVSDALAAAAAALARAAAEAEAAYGTRPTVARAWHAACAALAAARLVQRSSHLVMDYDREVNAICFEHCRPRESCTEICFGISELAEAVSSVKKMRSIIATLLRLLRSRGDYDKLAEEYVMALRPSELLEELLAEWRRCPCSDDVRELVRLPPEGR